MYKNKSCLNNIFNILRLRQMRETTQHLLVIIWHVLDDVCLGGELYELPAVWRNETLTELVGIPAVVFRLVQEILLLFHRAQLGHLLLNPRHIGLFLIFVWAYARVERHIGIFIFSAGPMETPHEWQHPF